MISDYKKQPDKSELSNGIPLEKPLKTKAEKESEYKKGRRDAALETRDAMLTAKESVVNMYETLSMLQIRQMMNSFIVEAGKKLTDAEIAGYKANQLLAMAAPQGPIPPLPGMEGMMGAPPPLPMEAGGGGLPPDLAMMGGGGGAPSMSEAAPPGGGSLPPELMGGPPSGGMPMG